MRPLGPYLWGCQFQSGVDLGLGWMRGKKEDAPSRRMRALNNLIRGLRIRQDPTDAVPARQHRPKPTPGKRKGVPGIEGLVRGGGRQGRPLGHVAVQHRRALDLLFVPGRQVAGEDERLLPVRLHGGVDGERVHEVHGRVLDGAEDEGRPDHVPLRGRRRAVREQDVFLRVVEVGLERDARVGFDVRRVDGAEVPAVVLEAGLEDDAGRVDGGELEGGEEVLEESACWVGGVGLVSGAVVGEEGLGGALPLTSHISSAFDHNDWPAFGAGWRYAKKKT